LVSARRGDRQTGRGFRVTRIPDIVKNVVMPTLARDGFIRDVEVQGLKKNGEIVDLVASSVVKRDANGKFLQSQTFLVDIYRAAPHSARDLTCRRTAKRAEFEEIVGASAAIQNVFKSMKWWRPPTPRGLLLGETGTARS